MGLPMASMHAPTIGEGTYKGSNIESQDGLSLNDLISKKEQVEAELSALGSVLDSVSLLKP